MWELCKKIGLVNRKWKVRILHPAFPVMLAISLTNALFEWIKEICAEIRNSTSLW